MKPQLPHNHLARFVFYFSLLTATNAVCGEGFPGRAKYPDIPFIEIDDLYKNLGRSIVVDTRSSYEFETLRIKSAINLPVASDEFEQEVMKLRAASDKQIVFYCNGHTCMKSYIAAKRALKAGVTNVIAYDAGIFDWTRKYPQNAELLGVSPVDPANLIPKEKFKQKLLDPDKFSEAVMNNVDSAVVIDIRDKFQRSGVGFYPGIERWVSLDNRRKLYEYINVARRNNKTLFFYDEVGKQVEWLQYALEKAGVKNYYFMDRGARAYYDLLAKLEWGGKRKSSEVD